VKILLVEDNLVNSEVAIELLATLGLEADIATNGEQALELFDTNKYSLILMDCEMPIMDGFTATKLMREKECESHQDSVPIIAITAHAISGSREKCLACGMDDFLSKPFSLADLCLILSRWLKIELADAPYNMDKLQISETNVFRSNADVLDGEILSRLFAKEKKCDINFLNNLVGIYLEQSSQLLDELLMACRKSDVESVRRISHTLKSSSANIGALNFSKLCRVVELTCEQGLIEDELIQDVYQSYPSVEAALKIILQNIQ